MTAVDTAISSSNLYDVIFFWDSTRDQKEYKQYCAETLFNLLGYNHGLAVKLVCDAADTGKTLITSSTDLEEATVVRDTLVAMEMNCQIVVTPLSRKAKEE